MADGDSEQGTGPVQLGVLEPETEEEREDRLLCLFFGPNANRFLAVHRALKNKEKHFSFNWVAMLFGVPWFFYRKLYLIGVAVLLLPIVVVLIVPAAASISWAGFAGAMAVLADRLYVLVAQNKLKKLQALGLSEDQLEARIRQAGGTSLAGAGFGALIIVSAVTVPVLVSLTTALPECDSAQVQDMAADLVRKGLSGKVPIEDLTFSDYLLLAERSDDAHRLCSFKVSLGADSQKYFVAVTWRNKEATEFQVSVGPTAKQALEAKMQ